MLARALCTAAKQPLAVLPTQGAHVVRQALRGAGSRTPVAAETYGAQLHVRTSSARYYTCHASTLDVACTADQDRRRAQHAGHARTPQHALGQLLWHGSWPPLTGAGACLLQCGHDALHSQGTARGLRFSHTNASLQGGGRYCLAMPAMTARHGLAPAPPRHHQLCGVSRRHLFGGGDSKSPYDILGINSSATAKEIKFAYLDMARRCAFLLDSCAAVPRCPAAQLWFTESTTGILPSSQSPLSQFFGRFAWVCAIGCVCVRVCVCANPNHDLIGFRCVGFTPMPTLTTPRPRSAFKRYGHTATHINTVLRVPQCSVGVFLMCMDQ